MVENICKQIIDKRKELVPYIFTSRQIEIIRKYFQKEKLSSTEKTYFYANIKKKIDALNLFKEEFYITGGTMVPGRVKKAKKYLQELGREKAFISGSFLYKKSYEDIDVYVVGKQRKSFHRDNFHIIQITEKDLQNPIFVSTAKYSVSTFLLDYVKPIIKRPSFDDLIILYQMVINEILNKEDLKALRELVLEYHLQTGGVVLDSFTLFKKTDEIKKKTDKKKIEIINQLTKEIFLTSYSKKYTENHLSKFLKVLRQDVKDEPHGNLTIFIDLFGDIKNECRTVKT